MASLAVALEQFMDAFPELAGHVPLVVDFSCLYHGNVARASTFLLRLVRAALCRPDDPGAQTAACEAIFDSIVPSFVRGLGARVRAYFDVMFVTEGGSSRYRTLS